MSTQQVPITYEQIMFQFLKTQEQMAETDRQIKETDRIVKEAGKQIAGIGSRIGQIVENMIYGDILDQFRDLGYEVSARSLNKKFGIKNTKESGEIDLLLEDGDVVILVEAKTTLKVDDVRDHIERMEKYRLWVDSRDTGDKRRLVGAVAGTVVAENVIQFAHDCGFYVIVQAARDVEIVPPPEGFVAREW